MKFTYPGGSKPLEGYTIKRGIGRGGFGEVYYATSDAGKEVALKLVRRNLEVELRGVTHCLNLKHPNLLALYDIRHDEEGDTWIVMEYVGGEALEDAIARNPNGLPIEEALAWIHGIGAGVGYLHDRGIVHRDLKPANVFSDDGIVKIGDYGLSKFISASRRSGQTESVGTVHYMAPEVANGRYGKEIDIYALGVMLYEVLTGRVPFDGESVGEVLMKHLTAQPELNLLSEPYRTAVARSLEKDPEKRIKSVPELLALLPAPAQAPQPMRVEAARAHAGAPTEAYVPRPEAPLLDEVAAAPSARVEEPVWAAIRTNYQQMRQAWREADLQGWQRVLIVIFAVLVLLTSSGIWIPAVVMGAIGYGVYRIVWTIWGPFETHPRQVKGKRRPPPGSVEFDLRMAADDLSAGAAEAAREVHEAVRNATAREHLRRVRRRRHGETNYTLPLRSPREKATELLGAMLLSAGVVAAICTLLLIVTGNLQAEYFTWLVLVSLASVWGVLIPSKLWEGTNTDPMMRRFALLIVGLGVGLLAYGVDQMLVFTLPYGWMDVGATSAGGWRRSLFDNHGAPMLPAYLAYFGLLFPVVRWWTLADPLRRERWRLGPAVKYGLWAWLLSLFWVFPSQWGVMVAFTAACALQLSAPWVSSRERVARQAA